MTQPWPRCNLNCAKIYVTMFYLIDNCTDLKIILFAKRLLSYVANLRVLNGTNIDHVRLETEFCNLLKRTPWKYSLPPNGKFSAMTPFFGSHAIAYTKYYRCAKRNWKILFCFLVICKKRFKLQFSRKCELWFWVNCWCWKFTTKNINACQWRPHNNANI